MTMLAGGTAAVIGGGKFANGAFQAAFGYLYNHCIDDGPGACFNNPMGDPADFSAPGALAMGAVAGTVVATATVVVGAEVALTAVEAAALRGLVSDLVAEFAANPAAMRAFLTPRELSQGSRWAAANFGKALERAVAEKLAQSNVLNKFLKYTSVNFKSVPDFASKWGSGVYDITTKGTAWGAKHLSRGYEGTLKIIEYVRP